MDLLVQYKTYEIIINAQNIWNHIINFDSQVEAAKEIEIERKFQEIMTPDNWIEITDYDYQQYKKALFLTEIYNRHTRIANTSKVICRLKEFNWEVIDVNHNYIIMYNYIQQSSLLIPNKSIMNQKAFVELINEAGLNISKFFSTV